MHSNSLVLRKKLVTSLVLVISRNIRVDRGTETDTMCEIHCALRAMTDDDDDVDCDVTDCVLYGPSTQNKIERWWRELHHRNETYFKEQLRDLQESGEYDSTNNLHRFACSTSLFTCVIIFLLV